MNIPVAAGVASSACGFAALVAALDKLYDWQLDKKSLSILDTDEIKKYFSNVEIIAPFFEIQNPSSPPFKKGRDMNALVQSSLKQIIFFGY